MWIFGNECLPPCVKSMRQQSMLWLQGHGFFVTRLPPFHVQIFPDKIGGGSLSPVMTNCSTSNNIVHRLKFFKAEIEGIQRQICCHSLWFLLPICRLITCFLGCTLSFCLIFHVLHPYNSNQLLFPCFLTLWANCWVAWYWYPRPCFLGCWLWTEILGVESFLLESWRHIIFRRVGCSGWFSKIIMQTAQIERAIWRASWQRVWCIATPLQLLLLHSSDHFF